MWVYQETKTNAAALVPTLPEDTAGESLAEKEAMTPVSKPLAELPPQKAPRRKPFQASRDCILLAAAYLFGTLMAGVLQALCDAEEMETLAYYLDCWRGVFAASSAAQAVGLFGAELAVVLGAAAVFLLLGLSAVGPLPIFLFAMLYGTGSGLLSAQLLDSLGAKQLVLFLLTASLPTALAAGALCLFGASALQVSSRIHAFSFEEVTFAGERFNRRIPRKRKHVFFALQQATCAVAFSRIDTMASITVVKLAVSRG